MNESAQSRSRRGGKRNDPRALSRFVEELSWLLSSYEDLDFKALPDLVDKVGRLPAKHGSASSSHAEESVQLLGTLPALFMDEELFPSNEDIAEFSNYALGVAIPRWHKKSKYEIIGHVVCNAKLLDETKLEKLVHSVRNIQDRKSDQRKSVKQQRDLGLSWNEVIQKMLLGEPNE